MPTKAAWDRAEARFALAFWPWSLLPDVPQEIHMTLWQSLSRFDGRCTLGTWVYRVAHNTATSLCTRQRRAAPVLVSIDDFDIVGLELGQVAILAALFTSPRFPRTPLFAVGVATFVGTTAGVLLTARRRWQQEAHVFAMGGSAQSGRFQSAMRTRASMYRAATG